MNECIYLQYVYSVWVSFTKQEIKGNWVLLTDKSPKVLLNCMKSCFWKTGKYNSICLFLEFSQLFMPSIWVTLSVTINTTLYVPIQCFSL